MTVRTQWSDPSAPLFGRSATWDSSAGDFVNGDILDVQRSLGGPARHTEVSVAAASSCSIRINSYKKRAPLHPQAKKLGLPIRDLDEEVDWTYTNAPSFDIPAGECLTFEEPISSVEFTALVGTVVVTVR